MGSLVIKEASEEPTIDATDAAGKALGRFKTEKAAIKAIARTYLTHKPESAVAPRPLSGARP